MKHLPCLTAFTALLHWVPQALGQHCSVAAVAGMSQHGEHGSSENRSWLVDRCQKTWLPTGAMLHSCVSLACTEEDSTQS